LSKGALIVGGSFAGIQAALDLARSGIQVHLVESSPFLGLGMPGGTHGSSPGAADGGGGKDANGIRAVVPHHLLNARLLEVTKHPNISVWTNTRVNRFDGETGRFQIELRQHPRYVDLTKCTACNDCVEVCPVTVPGTDHKAIYLLEGAQPGCAVIDKQGKAPCSNTCPGGIHVQGYVVLVAQARFREALDLIYRAIPFPGICGRICTHPCELNCRRAEVDEAVSIRLLKRFVSDWALEHPEAAAGTSPPAVPPPPDAQRVAIIGAGPAGMAVAENMVRRGYRVTVFEAQPVVGGMMAMGIPAYRLPRDVIRREVNRIEDMGVELQLNAPIGPGGTYTLDDLFAQGYEAIFIGVGAHKSHHLRIPGEDLRGVVAGIDLLKAINLSHQTDDPRWQTKVLSYLLGGVGTRVAIIGGGNTAMDVARSLKRLGVDDVRVLYRRTRAEMPALPEEIEEAEQEGIPIEFLVSPVRIVGDERGRVVALECVRMKLGEPDHSGRRRPVPIAGSEFSLDVEMVVPAIGQAPDLSFLGDGHRFSITREGTFNVDRVSYMTNRPGVFAAGDAITQPVSVIDAIGSAKQAAAGMDAYLRGAEAWEVPVSDREAPISRRDLAPEELVPKPRHRAPTLPMVQRMNSHAEVELGYDAETAIAEAQRCLLCGPCAECLACEAVCEPQAILHAEQERLELIEVGALIWADGARASSHPAMGLERKGDLEGVHLIVPDDPLAGSAAAARVMMELFTERQRDGASRTVTPSRRQVQPADSQPLLRSAAEAARIGVFICQCNGQISDIVDTDTVQAQADTWQGVAYSQVLAQSCSPEAADSIYQAVAEQDLNRVVLAACSCCSIDQVCYSCTYQRVRCKDNLLGRHFDRGNPLFEFVNIREECAWAHEGDPVAATSTAAAMIAAAVAKTRLSVVRPRTSLSLEKTVLILGNGPAATVCQGALSAQRIQALRLRTVPRQIRQTPGHFTVVRNGSALWKGSALVLAPRNEEERSLINGAFDTPGRRPRTHSEWGCADTHRPGVFICEPGIEPVRAGMAAAARVAAWLGQEHTWPETLAAVVDAARCRGCGDCEEICEFGAIQLQGEGEARVAWIDPAICRGGGVCATRCPAGAINTSHPTGEQIEAMLEAILA
jgi:NADPH-dependent glutamate synthase beta subunit-like oxidoreductase/NAD-dependent dihydropyrimidine dehydrogenase PreA subunit